MNKLFIKDTPSFEAITLGLVKNGYCVKTENITDKNYEHFWVIEYEKLDREEEKTFVDMLNDFVKLTGHFPNGMTTSEIYDKIKEEREKNLEPMTGYDCMPPKEEEIDKKDKEPSGEEANCEECNEDCPAKDFIINKNN